MRSLRCILGFAAVAVFLLSIGNVCRADGVDPKIVLGPTGSQSTFNQSECVVVEVGSPCSFTVATDGAIVMDDIINNTGEFIVQDTVTLITDFSSSGLLTCAADPESAPNWHGTTSTDGKSCIFSGGFISPNTSPDDYGLSFSGFKAGTYEYTLAALLSPTAPVPEPGTIVLLGSGLAAMVAGRKKFKGLGPMRCI